MTTVGSSTSTSGTSTSQSATSKATLGTNFNTFLNMLTTQLKHQDPLSPMDSTQFTNQLVQFSSVEQQINANSNLEKLISLQTQTQTAQSVSYLGQDVEVAGSTLPYQGNTTSFSYTLPSDVNKCEVQIKDSSGAVVYKATGDTTTGRHDMSWDGTNTSGKTVDQGLYTINVVASKADGTAVTATTTVTGQVTKVTNDSTNGATLEMGAGTKGAKVSTTVDKIVSVNENSSLYNTQMAAANAQYQAALAQYKALQAANDSSSSSSTTTSQ
jgi:flagellar basal-body rod modification protein FlgD